MNHHRLDHNEPFAFPLFTDLCHPFSLITVSLIAPAFAAHSALFPCHLSPRDESVSTVSLSIQKKGQRHSFPLGLLCHRQQCVQMYPSSIFIIHSEV